ncbi:unnamed protein product [Phytophthora fragariaefolia]|uniref:Unnamed protein product n=1 Tax=Phytophthora fragariaefolia TaxID=1490495 RepID=A0A9W6YMJ6_9STRA|nr:unnamed protein product [Phytophthora fragariaefolia]
MKLASLAVVAVIAVAGVSAADQPALRAAGKPAEVDPATANAPPGAKKEHWGWGGPWSGLGWRGGWGGGWGGWGNPWGGWGW